MLLGHSSNNRGKNSFSISYLVWHILIKSIMGHGTKAMSGHGKWKDAAAGCGNPLSAGNLMILREPIRP
jgi:hypothetical protein